MAKTIRDRVLTAPTQGIKEEDNIQTAVHLSPTQAAWLETIRQEVWRNGWRGITKSAILRSLIEAAREKDLELTGVSSEVELVEALKGG